MLGGEGAPSAEGHALAVAEADAAVRALHAEFLATPYRPTGLSTPARTIVRLVDDLIWLNAIVQSRPLPAAGTLGRATCAVKAAAAVALDRGADLLEGPNASPEPLRSAVAELRASLDAMERSASTELPMGAVATASSAAGAGQRVSEFVTALEPSFRAQELSFAVSQVVSNIESTAAAERRGWWERLLGRQPEGVGSALSAAWARAAAHFDRHSVWLHNSVRGAIALAVAVFVSNRAGVQHSFWVVLGTLSVLRSSALNTGQFIARAVLGTLAGFVIGSLVVVAIGTNTTLLWVLLPVAVLIAGVAPAVISFAAGQAAFTLTLLILFNIIQPQGWRIGLVRVEDVALGFAVSLAVGLLFWPRGAGGALRQALATAYADTARYLDKAIDFGMRCCDVDRPAPAAPSREADGAVAASRRLDDAFRSYLADRGAKPAPLAGVAGLVTGVAALRLTADAVLDLWQRDRHQAEADRVGASAELRKTSASVKAWYDDLATSLSSREEVPIPLARDADAGDRFAEALRHELLGRDGSASGAAIRMIWTADHLEAARRLEAALVEPAHAITHHRALRTTRTRRGRVDGVRK
jgi:hypothetical protein